MKKAIVAEARARAARGEIGSEVVRSLEGGPPAKAKEWAEQNGLPEHLHPGKGHAAAQEPQQQASGGPAAAGAPSGLPISLPPAQKAVRPARGRPAPAGNVQPSQGDTIDQIVHAIMGRRRQGAGRAPGGQGGRSGRGAAVAGPGVPAPGAGPEWSREAWCTQGLASQVQAVQGSQGTQRDEKHLLLGQVTSHTRAQGGTNLTTRCVLDNGQVAYHKPFEDLHDTIPKGFGQDSAQQPIHEVAAWRLAERLGEPYSDLVAPCVVREVNGKLGSFSLERPGVIGKGVHEVAENEAGHAAFFDCLIGQQDRHRNNFLVSGDRVTLIDHGYSFAKPGDYLNHSKFISDDPGRRLSGAEIDTLDRFLDSDDSCGLRGVLEPERLRALRGRAERMRSTCKLLPVGEY